MSKSLNHLEWLAKLISYDTTSRNSNLHLISNVADWFAAHKIPVQLTYDDNKEKANLFATLPAHNGAVDDGLILSGHTDVVPIDGQQWDSDPFTATIVADKLYGRGACDMKGFIAVVLALVPQFKKLQLQKPLHFAFSYDEEVGCTGVVGLIKGMQASGIKPTACIVGEPTEMQPVVAHKGINAYQCSVHGRATHSSLVTQGCNAIDYAAQFILQIRSLCERSKIHGPFDQYFDVPFTTFSTNVIKGGNAINTIPSYCEFAFEFRNLPSMNPQLIREELQQYIKNEILPGMRRELADADIKIQSIAEAPGLEASEDAAITKLVREVTGDQSIKKVAYATEAGLFQQSGVPTIVWGPGSIEQAHRANEFIALEQLVKCEKFLLELVARR